MLSNTRSWKRQLLQIWRKIIFFTIKKRLFLYVFSGTRDIEITFFIIIIVLACIVLTCLCLKNGHIARKRALLFGRCGHVFFTNLENLRFLRNGCELPGFWIKVAPKISVMGFGAPENGQNGKIDVFWASVSTAERRIWVIFHWKLKSFKNQLEWY